MINVEQGLSWLPQSFEIIVNNEYCQELLGIAYKHANTHSPDPSTKNGAVLMGNDGLICAYGVNKFPNGIEETEDRLTDKKTKYRLVVHAESSAIFYAAKYGKETIGSTLYCPFYACSECAKAIIQAGVKKVIGHAQLMALASDHTVWVESIVNAWNMLHEAGVECALYDGPIGVTTRFNGKDIQV